MKIVIHGTKGGYRILYSSPDSPNSVAGDSRPATSLESAVGKSAYSISFTADGYVFTKFIIVRDMIRSMATGNIAFSVYFPSDEKLNGSDAKALLDQISNEYHKRYLPENNLGNKPENWDFVTLILAEYQSKLKHNPDADEALKHKESTADAAYVYYSTNEELLKYLETPYLDEYFEGRFRQIFLVDKELDGKPQSPLKALKHNPSANLTGKIDLDNPKYKLFFNETAKGGIKIEVKVNGNQRSNKNKVRRKDIIEISYTKQYYQSIIAPPGRWTEIASEYIFVDDVAQSLSIKEVELKPVEKEIIFETIDRKGNLVNNVKVSCQNNYSKEIRTATNNKIVFRGEELKEPWTIEAKKEDFFIQPTQLIPENDSNPIILTVLEYKKVKFQVEDDEGLVFGCTIQVGNKSIKNDYYEIDFIGDEILNNHRIQVIRQGYETYYAEFCPGKNEEIYKITLNKKPFKTSSSNGSDDSTKTEIDVTWTQSNDNKESWFRKNRKILLRIGIPLVSLIIIWLLLLSVLLFLRLLNVPEEEPQKDPEILIQYIQGPDLRLDSLYHLKDEFCSSSLSSKESEGFMEKILGLNIRRGKDRYTPKPQYCIRLENAINIRNLINERNFSKLKNNIYEGLNSDFSNLLANSEDSILVSISDNFSSVDFDTLPLDSITNILKQQIKEIEAPKANKINDNKRNQEKPTVTKSTVENKADNKLNTKPKTNLKTPLQEEVEQYLKGDNISFLQLKKYKMQLLAENNHEEDLILCVDLVMNLWEVNGNDTGNYYRLLEKIRSDKKYSLLKNTEVSDFLSKMNDKGNMAKYWQKFNGWSIDENKTLSNLKTLLK